MSLVRSFVQVPRNLAEWERFFRDANVADNDVTDEKLRDSAGLSVIGRSVNSAGDPADIVATDNNQFLITRANELVFGEIVDADLPPSIERGFTVVSISIDSEIDNRTINLVDESITITLPAPEVQFIAYIKNVGTSRVTVAGSIDGESKKILLAYDTMLIVSDGASYYIL